MNDRVVLLFGISLGLVDAHNVPLTSYDNFSVCCCSNNKFLKGLQYHRIRALIMTSF